MKKLIVGLVAVGAVIALRPVGTRIGRKVREHCEQMAGECKHTMAATPERQDRAAGMREHCKEMMAAHRGSDDAAETHEQSEQEAPGFAGNGEAVAV